MIQQFWNRWSKEYLTALQYRRKWLQPQCSLEVEDLLLIKSETTPPSQWPIGRVMTTHPGSDNLVRAVTIQTAYSEINRLVVKIILLCTNEEFG